MIIKMVHTLTSFIKPAVPTSQTLDLIMGNAKNWGHTTIIILSNHYKDQITELIQELHGFGDAPWQQPFAVAANWARRSLGRRLLPQSVREAEEKLLSSFSSTGTEIQNSLPVEKDGATQTESHTHSTNATQTERPPSLNRMALTQTEQPPPLRQTTPLTHHTTQTITTTAQVYQPLTHSPLDLRSFSTQTPDTTPSPHAAAQQDTSGNIVTSQPATKAKQQRLTRRERSSRGTRLMTSSPSAATAEPMRRMGLPNAEPIPLTPSVAMETANIITDL